MAREQGHEKRPRFSVGEPFSGVVTVQMNQEFSNLLQRFIDAVDEAETVEPELWAFRRALGNPAQSKLKYEQKKKGTPPRG